MLVGLDSLPELIITCFVLHNFIEQDKIYNLDPKAVQEQIDENNAEREKYQNKPDPVFSHNTAEGMEARQTLIAFFSGSLVEG